MRFSRKSQLSIIKRMAEDALADAERRVREGRTDEDPARYAHGNASINAARVLDIIANPRWNADRDHLHYFEPSDVPGERLRCGCGSWLPEIYVSTLAEWC